MSYLSDILRTGQNVASIAALLGPGALSVFGSGRWKIIPANAAFIVPPGVTQIRARAIGAGAGGQAGLGNAVWGGAGGGYAHGVFAVTPAQSIACNIGVGGTTGVSGTTTTFGALLSATGGTGGANGAGGVGTGGDFQASGGAAVLGTGSGAGGSGAGSQLGTGGLGGAPATNGGGGGSVGGIPGRSGGASPFGYSLASLINGGPDPAGGRATVGTAAAFNALMRLIRFPFDCFTGGGGAATTGPVNRDGGPGCGGGAGPTGTGEAPGVGGDGGGGGCNPSGTGNGGNGGIGAGGGTSLGGAGGTGGNGLIIVEF